MEDLKEKLRNLPLCPGVYIMKDENGKVIYVGKSKLLKNRVSQYFQNSKSHTPKTVAMVSHIKDFDYIITDTEVEALALECNLIKKYRPKYNILLKDDKQYPYIKITENEDFPRIFVTRRIVKDGGKYFGPYMFSGGIKDSIETIKKVFKLRSCNKVFPRDFGTRPCLYHYIDRCSAPCAGKISKEEYRESLPHISEVLNGNYDAIIKQLEEKMFEASENLEFEKAARYRDKINNIKTLGEKQKITSTNYENRDVIGMFRENDDLCIQNFYIRDGKVVGSEYFVFENSQDSDEEALEAFVKQFYFAATNLPREILLSSEIQDAENIAKWLSERAGHSVKINVPKRGEKAKLIKMLNNNAAETLRRHKFKRDKMNNEHNEILNGLMKLLNLPNPPFRIESYDISNISGAQSIGAMVVYKNAKPSVKDYRRFNIKTVEGANDYESMREVIFRRISHMYDEEDAVKNGTLEAEKAKFIERPDLILLDGGKGHISTIKELFDTMGEDIPVFGLVKDDKHRTRALISEDEEFEIEADSELFKFLTRMQDEVHRYAITTYRKKHQKSMVSSELENIKGVGTATKNKLMLYFGSIDKIKNATVDELSEAVSRNVAENIVEYFKK